MGYRHRGKNRNYSSARGHGYYAVSSPNKWYKGLGVISVLVIATYFILKSMLDINTLKKYMRYILVAVFLIFVFRFFKGNETTIARGG